MRELFETIVRATSFGICNVTARAITISAPIIAIAKDPVPMLIVATFSAIAGGLSFLVRSLDHNDFDDNKIEFIEDDLMNYQAP